MQHQDEKHQDEEHQDEEHQVEEHQEHEERPEMTAASPGAMVGITIPNNPQDDPVARGGDE